MIFFRVYKRYLLIIYMMLINQFLIKAQDNLPADKKATLQTINLYNNLRNTLSKGFMMGHQDDLAYGVNWKNEDSRSDIKDVTGDYPAVYGWELGRIETDALMNLDNVPFAKMKQYIEEGYQRGGVITISWHLNNPLTGKTAWDPAPGTVASILPHGQKNSVYNSWLDKIASFMLSLKGKNGEYIPVIFRPFHELNGSWFWWGGKNCTAQELIQLYQYTETYLRDTKNVHNLLYAYNTDRFTSAEAYTERYPGDDFVDIIGFDIYQKGDIVSNEKFAIELNKSLTTLETIAKKKNKIPALTEFGYNELPDADWWTTVLYDILAGHQLSYALAWRNAGKKSETETEYYVPFSGQTSAPDFKNFYSLPKSLFEKEIDKQKMYD